MDNICLLIEPRDVANDPDYVFVNSIRDDQNSGVCNALVGNYINRGLHEMHLGENCFVSISISYVQIASLFLFANQGLRTITHEFLHSAGFYHEQSRPDRDSHVEINWQNVNPGSVNNFYRYCAEGDTACLSGDVCSKTNVQGTDYDSCAGHAQIAIKDFGYPYDTQSVMQYDRTG